MAKKAAKKDDNKPNASEACRLGWKALGKDAPGTQVQSWVKEKHGYDVPSSTVSIAKVKVFSGGKPKGRKAGKVRVARIGKARGATAPATVSNHSAILGALLSEGKVSLDDILTAAQGATK
jgi:hypothetical protein